MGKVQGFVLALYPGNLLCLNPSLDGENEGKFSQLEGLLSGTQQPTPIPQVQSSLCYI